MSAKLPGIINDLSETTATLRTAVAEISSGTNRVVGQAGEATDAATARLTELKATIANVDKTLAEVQATLASVSRTSDSVGTLVSGEGTGLVTDARATLADVKPSIAALNRMMTEDVPDREPGACGGGLGQHGDREHRPAYRRARDRARAPDRAGDDDAGDATKTMQDASATLDRIDGAIGTAEGALTAAQGTFVSAQRVMNEDVGPTAADIRAARAASTPASRRSRRPARDQRPACATRSRRRTR